jgi:hypothetical protein
VPFGGVGGLPVEGIKGASVDGDALSRGFRNIAVRTYCHTKRRVWLGVGLEDVNVSFLSDRLAFDGEDSHSQSGIQFQHASIKVRCMLLDILCDRNSMAL